MNILLIEPDMGLGQTYRQFLTRAGHNVDWRRTAQTAISAADGQMPDAVVLEIRMPQHNGIEFLYEFRSYVDWRDVPVIVHSLVPPENFALQKRRLQVLGVREYLYKPRASLQQLAQALGRLS